MSSRLVFSLTLSALIMAIGNLISSGLDSNSPGYTGSCIAQGWLLQFSENAVFAWITTIALNLYLVVCWHLPTNRFEKFYHLGVWIWAFFVAFIPFASGPNVYDLAGIWCWISKNYPVDRFLLFYVPFLIQCAIVVVLYVLIIKKILRTGQAEGDEQTKVNLLVARLRAYPIIFFVLYLFPTINRINDAVSSVDSFPLYVLQAITAPSIGLVNAIAYGFDSDIKQLWLRIFASLTSNEVERIDEIEASDDEISFDTEAPTVSASVGA